MSGYVHTGVGNATVRTQYASAGQVQDSSLTYLGSVSGTDTITASAAVGMSAYTVGQTFRFVAAGANTTTAVTININGIGAKNITKSGANALSVGDLTSGTAYQVIYDGTQFQLLMPPASNATYTGFKNRIINGAMQIDQRNNGAAVIVNDSSNKRYAVDRFFAIGVNTAGVFTLQQSSTAPTGFINSIVATVTTSATPATADTYQITQPIEGLNIADLGFGTASASTVTFSFWVRSSLTGTFGGSLKNGALDRSYPFSYVINSANTWEQKTITITGDITGTWLTTNGIGLYVVFSLGTGTSKSGTGGSWAAANYNSVTGATNLMGTNGATFYITGVQLEKGSTATSFDYRPYGTELALCQRYYFRIYNEIAANSGLLAPSGLCDTTTNAIVDTKFPVTMRIAPTALEQNGTAANYIARIGGGTSIACSSVPIYQNSCSNSARSAFIVASGLTVGQACYGNSAITTANTVYLGWSAEL
jgi:hypothetical protein